MTNRWAALTGAALMLAAVCVSAVGAEEVKSGLPVGGATAPFGVLDVTGPAKGSSLCYI